MYNARVSEIFCERGGCLVAEGDSCQRMQIQNTRAVASHQSQRTKRTPSPPLALGRNELSQLLPQKQIGAWCAQKDLHSRSTRLLSSLGKKITATQAKRLDSLSLSYEALIELRASSKDGEDFTSALHKRGSTARNSGDLHA